MAKIIKTKQKRSKKYRQGRLVAIVAVAAAVILVVGGIIYNHFALRESGGGEVDITESSSNDNLKSKTDLIQMTIARDGLDYDRSYEEYGKLVDTLEVPNEKRSVLLNQASFAINQEQYDDALAAAKKADEIKSDDGSLMLLARIYEYKNDKQGALEYYKKARGYYRESPPNNQAEATSLDEIIKLLEESL